MTRSTIALLAALMLGGGALAAEGEQKSADEHQSKMGKGAAPTTETKAPDSQMGKGAAPTTNPPENTSSHMGNGEAPR